MRRKLAALLVAVFALFAMTACQGEDSITVGSAPADSSSTATAAESTTPVVNAAGETIDTFTGLPVVVGGDPAAPAVGNQDASPDNTPAVLGYAPDWKALLQKGNAEPAFQECFTARLGWNWPDIPTQNAAIEATLAAGHDYVDANGQNVLQWSSLRFIQASNTTLSDEEIRAQLVAAGVPAGEVANMVIARYPGFVNTRKSHTGGCEAFVDMRPQVRVVLGSPVDPKDPSKGIDGTKGVVTSCGNPWTELPPQAPPVTPPPGTPPTSGPPHSGGTTTTTGPSATSTTTTTVVVGSTTTSSSTPGKAIPASTVKPETVTVAPATTKATAPPLAPPDSTPTNVTVVNPTVPPATTPDGVRGGTPTPPTSAAITPVTQPSGGGPTPTMA